MEVREQREALATLGPIADPQTNPAAEITAELLDIAAGTAERPRRGSGVVVAWHGVLGVEGGRLSVSMLRKAEIHADGGITPLTPT